MEDEERQLQHLLMIQNVITRMADNSFKLKSWSVALVTGLFALASQLPSVVLTCFLPATVFWGLDAYFLRQERLYRKLYCASAKDLSKSAEYSLQTSSKDIKCWVCFMFSPTIIVFHGAVLITIGAVALFLFQCK